MHIRPYIHRLIHFNTNWIFYNIKKLLTPMRFDFFFKSLIFVVNTIKIFTVKMMSGIYFKIISGVGE